MMLEHGFLPQEARTLRYARLLNEPIPECQLPEGFSIRHTTGEQEVEQLVALHRSAFGTDNMTVEQRLAMMHSPQYVQEMDLVVVAPAGELAAFCVCGFEDREKGVGYTDPIGTSARFQRRGLGRAVLSHGLQLLKSAGAVTAGLGTSSANTAMQRLAESAGFTRISEKLWFSKSIA
jgi:ribosomal protein S18 acetylase RimI-like enzyme